MNVTSAERARKAPERDRMETEFTPLAALFGGMLIGLGSIGLMAFSGRIMGATGIMTGLWHPASTEDWTWRIAVIGGMISAPAVMLLVTGQMPLPSVLMPLEQLLIGGFLVGVGVSFASGCTSGHGVCGIARLSARSIAATITFMTVTAVTVLVVRHGLGV